MKRDLNSVLIRPHVTEKATRTAQSSVYVFVVDPKSKKSVIEKAFIEKYKINPIKINTVTIPAKKIVVRGKYGKKSGYKKAYIYLKKGTQIENI